MKIQKGMNMAQITSILGKPSQRRFNEMGMEEWEYSKFSYSVYRQCIQHIIVDFKDGNVVRLNTFEDPSEENDNNLQPNSSSLIIAPAYPYFSGIREMNENDFNNFYIGVKNETFNDDKLNLIRIGNADYNLTCDQCMKLMNLFSFDDDKLKVLQILSRPLADSQHSDKVVNCLQFMSNRSQAENILLSKKAAK